MIALPTISRVLRTPDRCFAHVPDFAYEPRYTEVGGLRIAHIDEGPADAAPILLMHGEPTWSFLYRKMIPGLTAAGHRVIAPDLVGCGRSDKPALQSDYTYLRHVQWMTAWLEATDLRRITLFCQDWGSLIGLRMVVEAPDRFDRVIVANGGLPTGANRMPRAFRVWRAFATYSPIFPVGRIIQTGCRLPLSDAARAAYEAPFPSTKYKAGVKAFPHLVPATPTDPERENNERAWRFFEEWNKPLLTLFSSGDPITRGGERIFQRRVPGARGQLHDIVRGAGHFLQEDKGPELASAIARFVASTSQQAAVTPA
jgi:haloalkane dehalogenase